MDVSSLIVFDFDQYAVTWVEVTSMAIIIPVLSLWLLSIAPSLIIRKILKKVASENGGQWNKLQRKERTTHADRNVVIPSPDFVYSVVLVDLTNPDEVFHFRTSFSADGDGRMPKYASLGVYDCGGLCSEIVSHPGAEVDLVITSANSKVSDEVILAAMEAKCGPANKGAARQVVRMRTVTGVLLHRLLIEDPAQYALFRRMQTHVHCDLTPLPALPPSNADAEAEAGEDRNFRLRAGFLIALASARLLIAMSPRMRGATLLSLLLVTGGSLLVSAVLAFASLKLLRQPYVVSQLRFGEAILAGGWRFHSVHPVDPSTRPAAGGLFRRTGRVMRELVMFLHGALALLPSEVIYGVCMRDTDGGQLLYGGSYLVSAPAPARQPQCLWWSVTLYGRDLFLIENEENAFSINSLQLKQEDGRASANGKGHDRGQCILCSPLPPARYIEHLSRQRDCAVSPAAAAELQRALSRLSPDMPWIACPEEAAAPEGKRRTGGPRLVLRLYKPEGGFMRDPALAARLPAVERLPD